ncbi:MAG: hypothetical protein HY006_03350 [Candidatus Sungbacteria bacterium]|nr:hypothetical protein [Candidatus Sungbacteria bacterium]
MAADQNNKNGNGGEKSGNGSLKEAQPLKFLFVSWESLSGDIGWRLKQEGHEVRVYIKRDADQDVYDGFLEKVSKWEEQKDWADVIVFDDVGFGKVADNLRKSGKLVIGGSEYTDRLEEDREFGQEEMRRFGLTVLPHWDFDDYDEAVEFIAQNPGRYVFKPSGNIASDYKGILFIGHEESGNDLIEVLAHNKKTFAKKIKRFQLQKFAQGVEVAVGAFFNGSDFVLPVNINFEHKKLFPGDIGPSTGEMGCYDEQTEVLTKNGWRYFKDINRKDFLATLDPQTNELRYNQPSAIAVYTHHRKMVQIKNRSIDILVTPDHQMWVLRRYKKQWEFIRAEDIVSLSNAAKIARTAQWRSKTYQISKAQFWGIYLAEGYVAHAPSQSGHQVFIAAVNEKKIPGIKKILDATKITWQRTQGGWYCYDKKLHQELAPYGKSYEKSVPPEIKEANREAIEAFLDAYALGDGTHMPGGWRIFYTSSKKMADDIQELLLKIGRVGIIKERSRFGRRIWIKDHYTEQKHRAFEVIERVHKIYSYLDKRDAAIVDYRGKVYCATVPSHILYVRRNGKAFWCGNTLMYWNDPNTIFRTTLEKMKPALAESGYRGYIDINCIANNNNIYPLEFTSRFGYPTISIQFEGILNPIGEWFLKMAKGEPFTLRTKKGFQVGVVIAVPPFPYDDKSEVEIYKDFSIIFKRQNLEGVHLGDVKLVDDEWHIAGDTGYALVVTGSGMTVAEARKMAYNRIDNIILQNKFFRTDIGLKWNTDSDKLQSWGYLY